MDFDYMNNSANSVPVLYYDALSSQARSCYMLIKLLKIDVELRSTDSINDINFFETYTWINSFCILPTLVDGNITICNGHSILIYLCEKYATPPMTNICPSDYMGRIKVMSMLFYEGCILYRCLSHLLTDIFLSKYPNFNVDYHKKKVSHIYTTLNTFLRGHTYMIGNRLTIADLSIVSTVSALNVVFPIDYGKFPDLFDWFQRMKKKEFYNFNDEGILKLRYLLERIGKFPLPSPFAITADTTDTESNKSEQMEVDKKKSHSIGVNTSDTESNKSDQMEVNKKKSRSIAVDTTDSESKNSYQMEVNRNKTRSIKQNTDKTSAKSRVIDSKTLESTDVITDSDENSENYIDVTNNRRNRRNMDDLKEIYRRSGGNNSLNQPDNRSMACPYFPKNAGANKQTGGNMNCNCYYHSPMDSNQQTYFKENSLKPIKSCLYIQNYIFDMEIRDNEPNSSNRNRDFEKQQISCCCARNSKRERLSKIYQNNKSDSYLSSEESGSDYRNVKKQKDNYGNQRSEIIVKSKDDNNIEIKVTPKREETPKNCVCNAVGNNREDQLRDQDQEFQMLLTKVENLENTIENLRSDMSEKDLMSKSCQTSETSIKDIGVTDNTSVESTQEKKSDLEESGRGSVTSKRKSIRSKSLQYSPLRSFINIFTKPKNTLSELSFSIAKASQYSPQESFVEPDDEERITSRTSIKDVKVTDRESFTSKRKSIRSKSVQYSPRQSLINNEDQERFTNPELTFSSSKASQYSPQESFVKPEDEKRITSKTSINDLRQLSRESGRESFTSKRKSIRSKSVQYSPRQSLINNEDQEENNLAELTFSSSKASQYSPQESFVKPEDEKRIASKASINDLRQLSRESGRESFTSKRKSIRSKSVQYSPPESLIINEDQEENNLAELTFSSSKASQYSPRESFVKPEDEERITSKTSINASRQLAGESDRESFTSQRIINEDQENNLAELAVSSSKASQYSPQESFVKPVDEESITRPEDNSPFTSTIASQYSDLSSQNDIQNIPPTESNTNTNFSSHEFLVINNSDENNENYDGNKRLEGGCNIKFAKDEKGETVLKPSIQDEYRIKELMIENLLENIKELITIIFKITMKNNLNYTTKRTKSKIPRLIPHKSLT